MKKVIVPTLIVVLAVGGALAWTQFNKRADYKVSSRSAPIFTARSSSSRAAAVSASPPKASQSASASDDDVTEKPDAPESQYKAWRDEMRADCARDHPAVKTEHFDVNNDGVPDTICWRPIKTKDWGDFVDLEAIVTTRSGQVQTAYIILNASATEQQAICGDVDHLSVTQGKWTRKDFEEMGWDYIGPLSIDIEGSDCDPPWLFWPKDAKGDEVKFDFARL